MTSLVTGGNGFIGQALVRELVARGRGGRGADGVEVAVLARREEVLLERLRLRLRA